MTTSHRRTPFTRILSGDAPGSFVYRDDALAILMDIRPSNPGHVLIIPTWPYERLGEIPPEIAAAMMVMAQRLSVAARAVTGCEGVNLLLCDGPAAGMEVPHVHLHLIPRFTSDQIRFRLGGTDADRAELDALADALARGLRGGD